MTEVAASGLGGYLERDFDELTGTVSSSFCDSSVELIFFFGFHNSGPLFAFTFAQGAMVVCMYCNKHFEDQEINLVCNMKL